jgi:hypothetical protein
MEEDSIFPAHKIVVVPGAVNPSGFIEGSAPVFDTPGVCCFDFLAQIVQHSDAILSQSPAGLRKKYDPSLPSFEWITRRRTKNFA